MAKIKKAQGGTSIGNATKRLSPLGKKAVAAKESSGVVTDRTLLNKFIPLEKTRMQGPKYGTKAQTDSLRKSAINRGDFTEDKSGFLRPTPQYMKPKRVSSVMKKGGKVNSKKKK